MYINEDKVLQEALQLAEACQNGQVPVEQYRRLAQEYETLLGEIKFITKISDRLQNKLNGINENLLEQTAQLEQAQKVIIQQNEELRQAKEDLEAKVAERTQELQQANEDLQVSNRELDTFVYRASHDIKGPLASIMGVCNVAMLEMQEGQGRQYFDMLLQVATQLQNKLNRLLNINNLKNMPPQPAQHALEALVAESVERLQAFPMAPYIKVSAKVPPGQLVHTDAEIFQILLDNLLEYALKNTRIGGEAPPFLHIQCLANHSLQLFVSYKGEVIPTEFLQEVFKMFYRTSNNPQLTGMELYTANLAAEKLHGHVEVISSNEQETIFSVFLPQACVHPE
jgi:signal transduction histidine kinase